MRVTHLVVCSTLALFSACVDGASDHVTSRDGGTISTCGAWRCGFNAAELNGRSLQSLHLQGQANPDGVRIVGFLPPPLALLGGYTLTVENDEFVAKRLLGPKLRGAQLIGSIILVQLPIGLPVPVTIAGYQEVPSWADGGAPIGAYTLLVLDATTLLKKNVCTGSLLDPLLAAVTVLGGETYDDATKTVQPNRAGWFTLACAGSAAAKMKLMGYGPQSEFDGSGHPSTVAQRQATLKMITADYCGGGHSYTANGTPVVWNNGAGSVDSSAWHIPGDVEAVWNHNGAVCLDSTRLAEAEVACVLPSCDTYDVGDGEWVTHVAIDP
jgi:hypothetical protein